MVTSNESLEASEDSIDPRLDNRTGKNRPPLETFPAKPQQIDGPDVRDTVPRPEKVDENDPVVRKGMSSPGPHGLGDTEAVSFQEAVEHPEKAITAEDKGKLASDTAKTQESPKASETVTTKKDAK